MSMRPADDSGQPARMRRLTRIVTGRVIGYKNAKILHADNEDSDQTARMRRLI